MYEQEETMEHTPEMVAPSSSEETLPLEAISASEADSDGGAEAAPAEASSADPSAAAESADPAPQALETDQKASSELESLRRELKLLRTKLENQERAMKEIGMECAEFCELYPDQSPEELPDEVWDSVRRGIPIAAAFALAERRKFRTEEKARLLNEENRRRSSGSLEHGTSGYLSPDEVRSMTPSEVRANYQSILLSMQKWR